MAQKEKIRQAFERNAKALNLRPSIGRNTTVTKVRITEGLTCEVEEGDWRLTLDMGEKHGGQNQGANPGTHGRAALGSCLAMTYVLWANYCHLPYRHIDVEIQADYNTNGTYREVGIAPGYEQIRYTVTIESDAPEAEIMSVLDRADARCTYLDIFKNPQDVKRKVNIIQSEII